MNEDLFRRRWLLISLTFVVVVTFVARLAFLQLLSGDYKQRAENNAYYILSTIPSRGVIYDRNGALLVANRPIYDLMIVNKDVKGQLDTTLLAEILRIPREDIVARLKLLRDRTVNRGYSPYTPQVLVSQLETEDVGRFQEQLYKFSGLSIRSRTIRQYDYHHAAHLLGYLSEASPSDLERDSTIIRGDFVGRSGVERTYEEALRGVKGQEIFYRDSRGRIQGRLDGGAHDRAPIKGKDVTLAIDSGLQALGERLMRGKRGAIVAIEPSTGEVLAMVTAPGYDPALLSGRNKGINHRALEETFGKPLLNRAIQGNYPPGSTFKPAQGAIYLAEGVLTPETPLSCFRGYPRLGNRPKCHGHPSPVSLIPALTTSCNAYFCWGLHFLLDDRKLYPTVQEAFEHWKQRIISLGYGYRLGIDLPGEKRGYIPNSQVYDKAYGKNWNSSTIISIAIGQGEILATPLQIANLAAIIANRGSYYRPHVVRSIAGTPLDTLYTHRQQTGIPTADWEYIVQGMAGAVKGGTCRAANFAPGEIEVCGKTGTAENPHGKDHSAFIGFAPRTEPRIAVSVYVENGGFGAQFGVPIGRVMMEYYLRQGKLSSTGEAVANQIEQKSLNYLNDI
nr:penicillin-binding protein 2 [uncultured Porphyromonas sp.]